MKSIVVSMMALFLSGCIIYPVRHTYFVGDPKDGNQGPSGSCGYIFGNEDALTRDVADIHVQVSPQLKENGDLAVTILLEAASIADVRAERYELRSLTSAKIFKSIAQKVLVAPADKSHPYFEKWVILHFSVPPPELADIEMNFPDDSIFLDGRPVKLAPFRFHEVTRNDLFYGSVNC